MVPASLSLPAQSCTAARGSTKFGVLSVLSGETSLLQPQLWSVLRSKTDVGTSGYLGLFLGHRQKLESGPGYWTETNQSTFGADYRGRHLRNQLGLYLFGAATNTLAQAEAQSWEEQVGIQIDYRGKLLRPTLLSVHTSDEFNPDVGFTERPNAWINELHIPFAKDGGLAFRIGPKAGLVTDEKFRDILGYSGGISTKFFTPSKLNLGVDLERYNDEVLQSFNLFENVSVLPGNYPGTRTTISAGTLGTTNPSIKSVYKYEDGYFGGWLHSLQITSAVSLNKHIKTNVGLHLSSARTLTQNTAIFSQAVNLGLTLVPRLGVIIDLFGQHNSVGKESLGLIRLRWIFRPGSNLFLLLQQTMLRTKLIETTATAKLSIRWDLLL